MSALYSNFTGFTGLSFHSAHRLYSLTTFYFQFKFKGSFQFASDPDSMEVFKNSYTQLMAV
jgi:hypothetical protein